MNDPLDHQKLSNVLQESLSNCRNHAYEYLRDDDVCKKDLNYEKFLQTGVRL